MAHTWTHDPPIGLLQLLEYVAGTDLPFAVKMWMVDGMGVKNLQRLQNSLYRALIVNMKANLLEGNQQRSLHQHIWVLTHWRIIVSRF